MFVLAGCRIEMTMLEKEKKTFGGAAVVEAMMKDIKKVSEEMTVPDGSINTKIEVFGELRGDRKLKGVGDSNLPEGAVLTVMYDDPELT
ncbi:hypothetical protein D3H55_09030 [Bacillus salacetis]|uniref:Uncharacterized protein n=1 Tax=Bacillus salacetis TaxID=2315464 RepID=A0A3A1QZX5_9BACI|nr:hypothetical protein [Bacillus salacetis]RIW34648.1 hypothetical protein D3H55_09030 [Bacillus salacetis]